MAKRVSYHHHLLGPAPPKPVDWACEARHLPGGCGRALGKTRGVARFACLQGCAYDVCAQCVDRAHSYTAPYPAAPLLSVAVAAHAHPLLFSTSSAPWTCKMAGCSACDGKERFACMQCDYAVCMRCIVTASGAPSASPATPASAPSVAPPAASIPSHQASEATSMTGRRKALIIGINYVNTPNALNGCVNDALCMKATLIERHNFKESDMHVLLDDGTGATERPTRDTILKHMKWLAADAKAGDSLVLHYAGHGTQVKDTSGEELDGKDEALVGADMKVVTDDEVYEILVRDLPAGAKLHAIIDACHSGTALDIPFIWSATKGAWESASNERALVNRASKGTVIAISGCRDEQTSADTTAFTKKASGAMTFAFTLAFESLRRTGGATYRKLLDEMLHILDGTPSEIVQATFQEGTAQERYGVGKCSYVSKGGLTGVFKQRPQLTSASGNFDVDSKIEF